jgi:hypothetical protein
MAATFAPRTSLVPSTVHTNVTGAPYFEDTIEVTAGTGDYLAGGYLFSNTQLQALYGGAYSTLVSVGIEDHWRTKAGGGTIAFLAVWDNVNEKVQAYGMAAAAGVSTGFTEIANASANINGLVCSLRIRFY